jgi:hypothetical protein
MTPQAVDEIFELVKTSPVVISPEWVNRLHKKMMASSRVSVLDMNGNRRINHITIGATRQLSCVNVTIQSSAQGRLLKIQFCPYDSVDTELATFCRKCTVTSSFYLFKRQAKSTGSSIFCNGMTLTLLPPLLGLAMSLLPFIRSRYGRHQYS